MKWLTVLPLKVGTYPIGQSLVKGIETVEGIEPFQFDCSVYEQFYRNHFSRSTKESHKTDQLCLYHVNLVFIDYVLKVRPDVVFIISYSIILPEFLDRARSLNIKIVFWLLDDYRYRSAIEWVPHWKNLLPFIDVMLSFEQGAPINAIQSMNPSGVVDTFFPAYHPEEFFKKNLSPMEEENYSSQWSFCGTPYANRINVLNNLVNESLAVWGKGWNDVQSISAKLKSQIRLGSWVSVEEENLIYNGSQVCLNIHASMEFSDIAPVGDNLNPRTFCIAGAGAFQLVDQRTPLSSLFEPDREIVVYTNMDELKEKLDRYSIDQDACEEIALAGRKRAKSHHTYGIRIKDFLHKYFK